MKTFTIAPNIFALHGDIYTKDLFEGFWPLPNGVTLNSYFIKGQKTCLVDLVKDWGGSVKQYEEQLAQLGTSFEKLDYVVLNHLEPDHTCFLSELVRRNKDVEIYSTEKGIALVQKFLKVNGNLHSVKTGDSLDLGDGKVLQFYETPNVHWPETMMTFEKSSGTLFSCDAFGSYGALGDRMFNDEFTEEEHKKFEQESLRYYSNIVASFSTFVKKAIEKLSSLEIKTIAPSHGMIWRTNVNTIVSRYLRYAGYNTASADGQYEMENEVCVVWGSMYGFTKKGVDAVVEGIKENGLKYTIHEIPQIDFSFVLADAYKSKYLVIAMPTYEYKMFPPMAHFIDLCARKHLIGKTVLRIGSWGWVGGAQREYEASTESLKWNQIPSIEWQGVPDDDVLAKLKEQGKQLASVR